MMEVICVIQYAFATIVRYSNWERNERIDLFQIEFTKYRCMGFSRFFLAILRVTHARAQVLIKIDALVGLRQIKVGRAAF